MPVIIILLHDTQCFCGMYETIFSIISSILIRSFNDILNNYLSQQEIESYKQSGAAITSITVYAEKLMKEQKSCCGPECCN